MRLCVGATSRRIVEIAAELGVAQIVASRRQVDVDGGYTGLTQGELVAMIRHIDEDGVTDIVRDHGGPNQSGKGDDGIESFRADIDAGFDILHVDVTAGEFAKWDDAVTTQNNILEMFHDADVLFDIGGEHVNQLVNDDLLHMALDVVPPPQIVSHIISMNTLVRNDKQCGSPKVTYQVCQDIRFAAHFGIGTKAHNMDWVGDRVRRYGDAITYYNIAPELALIETDAMLQVLDHNVGATLLELAYNAGHWERWFDQNPDGAYVGTWLERAKCGVRYIMNEPDIKSLCYLDNEREHFVRWVIKSAIEAG